MLRRYKYTIAAMVALLATMLIPLGVGALVGGTTNLVGLIRVFVDTSFTTPNVATAGGELYVEGDLEADGNLNIAGTSTLTGATTQTGDLTCSGGAGALTFSGSAASIVVDDNDTTALLIGSTDQLNLVTIDTGNDTETVVITGTTATDAFHVDIGEAIFDEGVDIAIPAMALDVIRFCGNGSATGIAEYMGPVLLDDTEADLVFGGAGCDALDDATEATADAPWHAAFAFKPVAMVCVGVCTGASAANDAITYQMREDASDVTGLTCTAPAWTGDANPQQCAVRLQAPETVAANSTVAIKFTGTNDACDDTGDDFECLVYVTF